jgi:hypothetical protein
MLPTSTSQRDGADLVDAFLRAVERSRRSDLDRRIGAVIEIALDARLGGDQRLSRNGPAMTEQPP